MREVADRRCRSPRHRSANDLAFADIAVAHRLAGGGKRRAARPLLEQVAAGSRVRVSTGVTQARRFSDSAVAAAAGTVAAGPAARAGADPAGAVPAGTLDAPCVGAAPCRGVSRGRDLLDGRSHDRGLGATTGVASLLMFLGAEPPSFSFGFGCCACCGGGGGGGGGDCACRTPQHRFADRAGRSCPTSAARRTAAPRGSRSPPRSRRPCPAVEVRPVHGRSTLMPSARCGGIKTGAGRVGSASGVNAV